MKAFLRATTVLAVVCSAMTVSASPLLFLNYSSAQTQVAQQRAEALGLSYVTRGDFSSVSDLQGKSVIVMPGGNYANFLNHLPILQDFVQGGGYVWLNLAGGGCADNFAPGGVDFIQYSCGSTYNNQEQIIDSTHKYLQGDFDVRAHQLTALDFSDWNLVDLGHIANLPGDAATIMSNDSGASLVEYSYGLGWVVASSLTYGWGEAGGKGAPLDNMLLYAANQVRSSIEPDGGIPGSSDDPGAGGVVPEPGSLFLTAGAAFLIAAWIPRRRP